MIYTIRDVVGDRAWLSCDAQGRWSRAVARPSDGHRFLAAWAVLCGRAVALRYPQSGDLEQALRDTGGLTVRAWEASHD